MRALADGCLDDPRVEISIGDVGAMMVPGSRYDGAAVRQANGEQVVSGPHVTGNPRSSSKLNINGAKLCIPVSPAPGAKMSPA